MIECGQSLVRFAERPPKLGVARSRRSGASQAQASEAAQRIAPGLPPPPFHCSRTAEVTAIDL